MEMRACLRIIRRLSQFLLRSLPCCSARCRSATRLGRRKPSVQTVGRSGSAVGFLFSTNRAIGCEVLRRIRTMNGWIRAALPGVALTCLGVASGSYDWQGPRSRAS